MGDESLKKVTVMLQVLQIRGFPLNWLAQKVTQGLNEIPQFGWFTSLI